MLAGSRTKVDLAHRASLVRACRLEIKQRRNAQRTPEEERDANFGRWLRSADRNRPRLNRRSTDADRASHRARVAAYESDIGRRGGFQVGERLRQIHESGNGPSGSEARATFNRRMNVRFQSRTGFSGPNGVLTTLTPSQRVNRVGTASRRRRVSPGLVPNGRR